MEKMLKSKIVYTVRVVYLLIAGSVTFLQFQTVSLILRLFLTGGH